MDISDSSNKQSCSNCKKNKLCKECQRIAFPLTCKNLEKRGCRNITIKQDEFCDICKEKQKTLNDKHRQIKKIIKEENRDINDICRFCNKTLKKTNKFGDNSHNECYKKDCDKNNIKLCNGWEHYGCRTILDNNKGIWCDECFMKKNGCHNKNKNDGKIKCNDCDTYKNDKNLFIENRCVKCYEKYVVDSGKKICSKNGCYKILNMTDKQKCEDCLTIERGKDKKRAEIKKEMKEINPNICISCGRECEEIEFIGYLGKLTQKCGHCRYLSKIADEKRKNDEHRKESKKEYEKTPEVKEMRKKWRENNYDKVTRYWIEYRGKMIESDLTGYLKRNAERMKKYRDEHEEMFEEIYKKQKIDDKYRLKYYKYRAEHHNIKYDIDDNIMIDLFHEPCVYCGIEINDKKLNGVDRVNNDLGYIESNVVSCCEMCNYIKKCMDSYVFIKKCEHILTYNKLIEGKLYDDFFVDRKNIKIEDYIRRANKKNINFELSCDEFNNLILNSCYICGKKTSVEHTNGIDRYDNKKGYIIDNCRSCCGDCNYMKKEYEYGLFMNKIIDIYNNTNVKQIKQKNKTNEIRNDNNKEINGDNINDNDIDEIDSNGTELDKIDSNETDLDEINSNEVDSNEIDLNEIEKINKMNETKIKIHNKDLIHLYKQKELYENNFDDLDIFKMDDVFLSDNEIEQINNLEENIKNNTILYEKNRKKKNIDQTMIVDLQNQLKDDKKKCKKLKQKEDIQIYKELYKKMLMKKIDIEIKLVELKKEKIHNNCNQINENIEKIEEKYDEIKKDINSFLRQDKMKNIFNTEQVIIGKYNQKSNNNIYIYKDIKMENLVNKYCVNKNETIQRLVENHNK